MQAPSQPTLLEENRTPEADPARDEVYEQALERAGRWLALRARTEQELNERLVEGGFAPEIVQQVLGRLRELGLVDDADFARTWIAERSDRKDSGPLLLAKELREKGIDEALIAAALDKAFPDESQRATEVAAGLVGKWSELPLPKQAARLSSALARKGFSPEAVEEAVTATLPPEGWD